MFVVDVGANIGEFAKHTLESCGEALVYAIEPNIPTCSNSLDKLSEEYDKRLRIGYFAIGINSGKAKLFGSNIMNGQLGSLLNFNKDSKGWVQHQNHLHLESNQNELEVDVLSSADFIKKEKINKIDFLKIDTQGTDLDILKSLLDCTEVISGVVEVEVGLPIDYSRYIQSENDINHLFRILSSKNLFITKILPNNSSCDEINVFFASNQEVFESISSKLELSTNPIFAKYWKIYGVGLTKSETDKVLMLSLLRKFKQSLKHPIQSFRSLLVKLTK